MAERLDGLIEREQRREDRLNELGDITATTAAEVKGLRKDLDRIGDKLDALGELPTKLNALGDLRTKVDALERASTERRTALHLVEWMIRIGLAILAAVGWTRNHT